ncbi:MAG: UDP-2,3-diacylglucosamine diphosphatase LpxI [Alphaproteobacteria bacterium]
MKQLGILAGGGMLPQKLLEACDQKGISAFVVGFEGQTDPMIIQGRSHMWTRLGAAGHIIKTLKSHGISDLVFIGSIRHPTIAELRPDLKAAEFFARASWKVIGGDNGIGEALREFLGREGFRIHGIQSIAQNLLAPEGLIGRVQPDRRNWLDIEKGVELSQQLGRLDIGQAVIVQEGIVLAVEAAEGTDRLMERAKTLMRKGRGGVLVKTCKPQQDRDFDLPTVGPQTILNAAECGLAGVAIHAGHSLLINPEEVAQIADKHKMFVIGIEVKTGDSQE